MFGFFERYRVFIGIAPGCFTSTLAVQTRPTDVRHARVLLGSRLAQAKRWLIDDQVICLCEASVADPLQAVIRRGEKVEGPPGPIVVTTRNDDLQAVIDATPSDRREGKHTY